MSTRFSTNVLGNAVSFELSGSWAGYWIAFLRVITGWWFLHAGLDKYLAAEPFDAVWWLTGATAGTIIAPVTGWFGQNAPGFVNVLLPLGQLMIGLGLLLGVLTRLAAFFGAFLMFFFYFGNADWEFGFVNGDLFGLLLFITLVIFGAGRIWGLDEYLEQTTIVQNNWWLRYFLG